MYQLFILNLKRMKASTIIFGLQIVFLLISVSRQCHYSCKNCTDQLYSGCTECQDSSALSKISVYSTTGICVSNMVQNANIFGICFIILVGSACFFFMSQQIFYFGLFFQTIGLLYIIQTSWIFGIDFILSGLNYLMVFSRISFAYKQTGTSLSNETMFKSNKLFTTTDLIINFTLIGLVNAVLFALMIIIPVFKTIRKRINQERANCLSDVILDKILLGVRTFFLMNIQQSVQIIYFSFGYGINRPVDYVITIIYFMTLIYFVANQWINPFPYFRSKFAQLNIILSKLIIPIFVVLSANYQFILFIVIVMFVILDIVLTNKNRNNRAMNRLLIYKIIGLLTILGFMANYIVDLQLNNEHTSSVIGYLVIAILCFLMNLYALEIYLQWRAIHQLTKVGNFQKSNIQLFNQSKNQTMISLDNKQNTTQHIQFNAINLNVNQIKPEINHNHTYIQQIGQVDQIKDQHNKYKQYFKPQLNQLIQNQNIIKIVTANQDSNFNSNNQEQKISIQPKPAELEPKQQNYIQTFILQKPEL